MKRNFSVKEWQGNKNTRVRTRWGMFTCLFLIVLVPSVSQGGNVRDVITDIYGGDGIELAVVGGGHNAHFTNQSLDAFSALNSAIVSQLSLFAINSTVAGYSFDTERGVPVRKVQSLGPIFGETSNTVGKGRFNFQLTFTRADYTRFDGTSLDSQSAVFTHDDTPPPGLGNPAFENDTVDVDLNIDVVQEVVAAFFTYGITDNWDVNVVVPVVQTEITVKAKAKVVDNGGGGIHVFNPAINGDSDTSKESEEKTGIGDVVLRTKYNFLRGHDLLPDMAVRGDVTLPTGDEKDLHGTGNLAYRATLIGSKYFQSEIGPWGPHANLSLQIVENHSDLQNFSWIAGFDIAPHPQFVLAMDFLGRHKLENRSGIGADIVDFAPGFKWAFYKQFLLQSVVQIPVNKNEGLRADAIWTVGVGATF